MADGLALHGISIGERTCDSYRNGITEPAWSLGRRILQAIDADLAERARVARLRSAHIRELLG